MWHAYLARLFSQIGAQLAAVGAAIGAVLLLIAGHKRSVSKAQREGTKTGAKVERERIKQDTEKATEYLEQRADEIEREINDSTADPDDLRQRMRDAAAADHRAK